MRMQNMNTMSAKKRYSSIYAKAERMVQPIEFSSEAISQLQESPTTAGRRVQENDFADSPSFTTIVTA